MISKCLTRQHHEGHNVWYAKHAGVSPSLCYTYASLFKQPWWRQLTYYWSLCFAGFRSLFAVHIRKHTTINHIQLLLPKQDEAKPPFKHPTALSTSLADAVLFGWRSSIHCKPFLCLKKYIQYSSILMKREKRQRDQMTVVINMISFNELYVLFTS